MPTAIETHYRQISATLSSGSAPLDRVSVLRFVADARDVMRTDLALAILQQALAAIPDDVALGFARAQLRYESGLSSAQMFEALRRHAPDDLRLVAATSAAVAREGAVADAEALIEDTLVRHPAWIEGHRALCALRWQEGVAIARFADSFARACHMMPNHQPLWLAWFHTLAQAKAWDQARSVIEHAKQQIGSQRALTLAQTYVASESGDDLAADQLFTAVNDIRDPGLDLCRARYGLRKGRLDWAEEAAERVLQTPAAANAWPYLSLIWRLKGDARAAWLDAPDATIAAFDLSLSRADIFELSHVLARLHTARGPHLDQSVRGGTQTDQPLFFRHEPIITTLKAKIDMALRDYVAGIPPADVRHPLLGAPRQGEPRFSGSWSVQLAANGYHVPHTHPMGWISSSFYVALPPHTDADAPEAGWISFGTPPPELGLTLAPYTTIEPKVGRLVLFPSTMWHSTNTFRTGERLVVAFDAVPRGAAQAP